MYNIDLKEDELETLINKLEQDNKIIVTSIEKIYDIMIKIEKEDWNSPEKIDMDNNFIPYLKNESIYLKNKFAAQIKVLKYALNSYREKDKNMIKNIDYYGGNNE